jgi:hypothetical protein
MQSSLVAVRWLLAFGMLASLAVAGQARAQIAPPTYTYALKIYNDSDLYNIYPVIATPTNDIDEWLQGGFQVPKSQTKILTYAHKMVYRLYINPLTGIPPHGSVSITLPLLSQLADIPDPTKPDQYIDWWNGGRVYIYDALASDNAPPPALVKDYEVDQPNQVTPLTPGPSCAGCEAELSIFQSPVALPGNDPAQLTEYTLDGLDKGGAFYKLVPATVDYDISYVDHVYLPAAMGPVANPDIGYIGSIGSIERFRETMNQFLDHYVGWPRYLDPLTAQPFLRIPGTYNALVLPNASEPTENPEITKPGEAITNLKTLWMDCTLLGEAGPICDDIRTINSFFLDNYGKYKMFVAGGACTPPTTPPGEPPLQDLLTHVYGWVPWNAYCHGGAAANDLKDLPNFSEVHTTYIALQYASPLGTFNPYVDLVHGRDFLDMPGSYAFSIDDDVGNMLVAGEGIIVTIGGSNGLENEVQFDKKKIVNVNLGDPNPLGRPVWSQYGFCNAEPERDIKSLSLQITSVHYPCGIVLTDAASRTYTFTLQEPPYPPLDQMSSAPITDCSAPGDWCDHLFAYTEQQPAVANYVVAPPPPPGATTAPTESSLQ